MDQPQEPQVQRIDIDKIIVPAQRMRAINQGGVDALAESISESGLINPITLDLDLVLVTGAHRLLAHQKLGLTTIAAFVLDIDGLGAQLVEIDENLIRTDLAPMERADALKARKLIYETLHPDTKHGGKAVKAANARHGKASASSPEETTQSFVDSTAAKTGLSPKTISADVRISKNVADEEVRKLLAETGLDQNRAVLRELATGTKTPEQQIAEIEAEVAKRQAPKVTAKNGKNSKAKAPTVEELMAEVNKPLDIPAFNRFATVLANIEGLPDDHAITLASLREGNKSADFKAERIAAALVKLTDLVDYLNNNGGVYPVPATMEAQ